MRVLVQRVTRARVTVAGETIGEIGRGFLLLAGVTLDDSQFTLYADCRKGRRPSFVRAAPPAIAEPLVDRFEDGLRALGLPVATGHFGAEMQVELVNDGPVTIWLDST